MLQQINLWQGSAANAHRISTKMAIVSKELQCIYSWEFSTSSALPPSGTNLYLQIFTLGKKNYLSYLKNRKKLIKTSVGSVRRKCPFTQYEIYKVV